MSNHYTLNAECRRFTIVAADHIATDCTSKDRLCFNCRQPGHESRACPKPRGVLNRKCGGCGEKGHVADDCEHREVGAVGPSPNITSMGPFINRIALDMQELC